MTTTTVVAAQLILTVDGHDLSCQATDARLVWNTAASSTIYVGCGTGVPDVPPPDQDLATLTTNMLLDLSDSGWVMSLAGKAGQLVPCVLNLDVDKAGQATTYTGTVRVPNVDREWTPNTTQRVDVAWGFTALTGPTRYTAPTP